ncbi:MAG: hypothetical protein OCC45_01790 [Desulfotalea sp.]
MSPIIQNIFQELIWPLIRISFFVSIGLVVAQLVESFAWSRRISKLSAPITRIAHLSAHAATGFTLAFVSGVSANSLLAEAFADNKIGKKELILANLLNSLPRFFLHLPTVFFLTLPFIKSAAFIYVGITFSASVLLTLLVMVAGRILLPKPSVLHNLEEEPSKPTLKQVGGKITKKLKRRMKRMLSFMLPIYCLFYLLGKLGFFTYLESLMLSQSLLLKWLPPESIGIIILHIGTEFSAGLAAAGAMLAENSLNEQQIVFALIIGNLLATPIRAIRHQFPYYSGIYSLPLAIELICWSQVLRAITLILISICYWQIFL